MDYSYLTTCEAMTEDDFRSAVSSKQNTTAFLMRIAKISVPDSGVGNILHFFVRLTQSEQMRAIAKDEFEEFTIQVSRSRDTPGRFIVRLAAVAGLEGRNLYKVSVYCDFDDFLKAANERENMNPFVCTNSREDFMFFEATQTEVENSIPPKAYQDADARFEEMLASGMLSARNLPTIPPPDEGPDPHAVFADTMAGAVVSAGDSFSDIPLPNDVPAIPDEPPSGLIRAIVQGDSQEKPRPKFDSLAEEAEALARQEPSLPNDPIGPEDSVREGLGATIGRLSLVQMPADQTDGPRLQNHLRNRPETERPPGIEDADELLPLITANKSPEEEKESLLDDESQSSDEIDEGW